MRASEPMRQSEQRSAPRRPTLLRLRALCVVSLRECSVSARIRRPTLRRSADRERWPGLQLRKRTELLTRRASMTERAVLGAYAQVGLCLRCEQSPTPGQCSHQKPATAAASSHIRGTSASCPPLSTATCDTSPAGTSRKRPIPWAPPARSEPRRQVIPDSWQVTPVQASAAAYARCTFNGSKRSIASRQPCHSC